MARKPPLRMGDSLEDFPVSPREDLQIFSGWNLGCTWVRYETIISTSQDRHHHETMVSNRLPYPTYRSPDRALFVTSSLALCGEVGGT